MESDERRSLEERTILFGTNHKDTNKPLDMKPSYLDPVLALRMLAESMVQLNHSDDVERIISDCLERELKKVDYDGMALVGGVEKGGGKLKQ